MTDQRVDRTCRALTEAGYRVTLIGRRLPASVPLAARPYRTERMRLLFRRSALFYAEYNIRLLLRLLTLKADAFYANDSDTLPACAVAAKLRRKPLLFDAHELFPDVPELEGRTRVQAVWRWVEKRWLPRVTAAFTVCKSVADEYRWRYGIEMKVVRNMPDAVSNQQPVAGNVLSTVNLGFAHNPESPILLYQGAVNVGRGVREMLDTMEWLPDCRLVIAGDGDERTALEQYADSLPWKERVVFTGRLEPATLKTLTRQASLGLCLLEDLGLNYRYSLPNRIGDFAQAGVPLLATDFPEIAAVLQEYGIGQLVPPCPQEKGDENYRQYVRDLSRQIADTLDCWKTMPKEERERRFARAGEELCWEREKKVLIEAVDAIFCP